MLTISAAIDAYMAAASDLTAIISDRLYPERADQDLARDAGNYVTYHIELRPAEDTLDLRDAGVPATLMIEASIDFVAMSRSYDEALQIAEVIRIALSDFQGVMGGTSGIQVDSVQWIETQGGYFAGVTADLGLFGALSRFVLQYIPQ